MASTLGSRTSTYAVAGVLTLAAGCWLSISLLHPETPLEIKPAHTHTAEPATTKLPACPQGCDDDCSHSLAPQTDRTAAAVSTAPLSENERGRQLFELSADPGEATIRPLDVVDVRHPVRLNRTRLDAIKDGDTVPIAIPGQGILRPVIGTRRVDPTGNRCWTGHAVLDGRRYMVVWTQGSEATFATISSPWGNYALEAMGDDGLLFLDNRDEALNPAAPCSVIPRR